MSTPAFQNENIKINLKRDAGCRVHLEVEVTPQATQASYRKAIKSINKEISLPGFRKGKAPEGMILKSFGPQIESEWKNILLDTSFNEALTLSKLYPFSKNSVSKASVKNVSLEQGATLIFEYETTPEVPSVSLDNLSIPSIKRHPTTSDDVEEAIEDLRLQKAEWTEITDRPVQEGDFVEVDIDALTEPARNICTHARFAVAPKRMGAWMRRLVVGMAPGQMAEGMSEKEEEHEEDCQACESGETQGHTHSHFTPTLCRLMLHNIKQAKMPDLNDDFAKTMGANDLADLRQKVEISLNKRSEEQQKNRQRHLMEEILLAQYPFEIPYSLVQGQVKTHKKEIIDNLRSRGTEESEIVNESKKVEDEAAQRLLHSFRIHFLIQKIAKDNKIEVSKDELVQEWMRQMWFEQMGQNTIDTSKNPEEVQSQLEMELLARKALDFIIEKAKTT